MKSSIRDTNAINKPVKGYRQPAKEKYGKPERASAPNYRTLSQTPAQIQKNTISGQVQFGQPPTDPKRTAPKTVPPRVSNRISIAKQPKVSASPQQPSPTKPLQLPDTTKKFIGKSYETTAKPMAKKFRNLFDHPLTERELNQLKLAQLKGKSHKETKELLEKLVGQSKQLVQKITQFTPKKESPKLEILKGVPLVKEKEKEKPEMQTLTNKLLDLQEDFRFIDQDYSKLPEDKQKEALRKFRDKYKAGKKANTNHIKKLIQDEIAKVRQKIQTK
jgi:hypothetical protein